MSATNNELIFRARVDLFNRGIIGTTGRTFEVMTPDGPQVIQEPEQIHTFAAWKSCGYHVKRGARAVAKIEIWNYAAPKKNRDSSEQPAEDQPAGGGYCYLKTAAFFSASQVERIEAGG